MAKHLGNNFWEINKNQFLHTKTGVLMNRQEAAPVCFKNVNGFEIYEDSDFWTLPDGYKYVIIDICLNTKRHKKTTHVSFEKFSYFDDTWRKYDSWKESNGFYRFDYHFIAGHVYKLFVEANHEFPADFRIIKAEIFFKNDYKLKDI